jgi:hypothetical protein
MKKFNLFNMQDFKNQNGLSLIIVIIFISISTIITSLATKSLLIYQKSTMLKLNLLQSFYHAESGLKLSPLMINSIPEALPPSPTLDEILAATPNSLCITDDLCGTIYLLKSIDTIYSIGLVKDSYKTILSREYYYENSNLILGNWKKL